MFSIYFMKGIVNMLFNKCEMLLPKDADMTKWSVVACDQYTSEPKYWKDVEKITENSPSAYNLILPEVYLEDDDVETRIENINKTMKKYLSDNVFKTTPKCYIYVERTLGNGSLRKGIMGCIDLEEYEYTAGSKSKIRATEKTIVERIPPRLKVRENAPLELPHVMVLIDNEKKDIIEPLGDMKDSFDKVYDFDLMANSGHIAGYILDEKTAAEFEKKLLALSDTDAFNKKYDVSENSPLVFAVGDGNHSLATAKEFYNRLKEKTGDAAKESAARYALIELVNLHDDSLVFEAIHRLMYDIDEEDFVKGLKEICAEGASEQTFTLLYNGKEEKLTVKTPDSNITVGSVQNYIDRYIAQKGGKVDYIHGEDSIKELTASQNVGIVFDAMDKGDLFKTVILDGALPRKTFSMGDAGDKRFYTEARIIQE